MEDALEKEVQAEEDVAGLSSYFVRLEAFEGPFDLLLHMIDEGKVDIYTISLTQIIRGYTDYMKMMKELDIVIASEFLLMASYLIEMKSRMLLPVKEEPQEEERIEDIEKTLLDRLHEYNVFKELAVRLKKRKEIFGKSYSRHHVDEPVMEEEREVFLTDVTLRDLVYAFQRVWKAVEQKEHHGEIEDEAITLPEKISEIQRKLSGKKDGIPFEDLFTRFVKIEVVVTFLAILELARQRKIQIRQGANFDTILIVGK